MNITIAHSPLPGLPPPTGPHELAWSYILDAVFADAYHAGVKDMHVVLPTARLTRDVEVRAFLSQQERSPRLRAVAVLGGNSPSVDLADRVYMLGFGTLAPGGLRRLRTQPLVNMKPVGHLSCFTLSALLWGFPIRLARLANRPDLVDRALAAMRQVFATPRSPHAYYQLTVWEKS